MVENIEDVDFEKDVEIDETLLDAEWLEHEKVAIKYIRMAAEARRKANVAAEHTKTVRSELINEANEDPDGLIGKSKPNAGDIEAYYRTHPSYKEAKQAEIDAEYEANYAEMAKAEICFGRRKALENLVTLHGQSYFAGPREPHDLSEARKKKQEQKDAKVARKMSRGKQSKEKG